MRNTFFLLIFFFNLYCSTNIKKSENNMLTKTKSEIESLIKKSNGTYAVAYNSCETGETILINEKENFHAASTMKTPVMIEVFKQAAENKFSLKDSVLIKNEFKSIVDGSLYSMDLKDDSDDDLYKFIGKKTTIYDLLYKMITVSSNLSTNILIDIVDAKRVTATMRSLGAQDIQVLRGVEDNKAYKAGLNNTTTSLDLMIVFNKIAQNSLLTKIDCEEMIKILSEQRFNDMIPFLLPKNVRVVHKTGSITGVQHDSGIVYLPDGRKYVLVILSKNLKDSKEGINTIAEISRIIYSNLYAN